MPDGGVNGAYLRDINGILEPKIAQKKSLVGGLIDERVTQSGLAAGSLKHGLDVKFECQQHTHCSHSFAGI